MIKRQILHWTAGAAGVSENEKDHYNFITGAAGVLIEGRFAPEDQNPNAVAKGTDFYAAHTKGCNTGSIGHAIDAMAEAKEKPFDKGSNPITEKMLAAFISNVATIHARYNLPISRETLLSHAEVQPTLGIKQNGKWDITWLPGMKEPGDPVEVGDKIRDLVEKELGLIIKGKTPFSPIAANPEVIIRRGSRGEPVARLQRFLNAFGLTPGVADGIYGLQTENALMAFQQLAGITIDGIAGPEVWAALNTYAEGLK